MKHLHPYENDSKIIKKIVEETKDASFDRCHFTDLETLVLILN